jgi:predicted dehydrogenase
VRERRRYALVGTGSRAEMFLRALATDHADRAEVVALADPAPEADRPGDVWLSAAPASVFAYGRRFFYGEAGHGHGHAWAYERVTDLLEMG